MKKFNISFVFILFSLFIASDEEIIRNSLEKILPAGSEIEEHSRIIYSWTILSLLW
jgi:hypothetical protein